MDDSAAVSKRVFTQYGLVAKVGDNLDDNTTLSEILNNGGVAINLFSEVAFHGKVGGPNVVVVGLAPLPNLTRSSFPAPPSDITRASRPPRHAGAALRPLDAGRMALEDLAGHGPPGGDVG